MKEYNLHKFFSNKIFVLIPLFAIFVFLCVYNIHLPGLYYDEALFVNGALLGRDSDMFIHKRLFDIPFTLMPYIGALKAWFYFPIFKLIDISIYSIRLPMVLIGLMTMILNYLFVKKFFNKNIAIIFLVFSVFDISTIMTTRIDWGPTTLMMFFRVIFLYLLMMFWRYKNKKYLYYSIIVAFLGIFDKANFIWIVNAGFASLFLIYFQRNHTLKGIGLKLYLKSFVIIMILLIILLLFFDSNSLKIFDNISFRNFFEEISIAFNGFMANAYGVMVGQVTITTKLEFFYKQIVFCLLFLLSLLYLMYELLNKKLRPEIIFIFLFLLLILIQIAITPRAGGPHHFAIFSPLFYIIISYALFNMMELVTKNTFLYKSKVYFVSFILILNCIFSLQIYNQYIAGFKHSLNLKWSKNIYSLVDYINNQSFDNVICVDWGLCTQIQALSNNSIIFNDLWPVFNLYGDYSNQQISSIVNERMKGNTVAFISFTNSENIFPEGFKKYGESFLELARFMNWEFQEEKYPFDSAEYTIRIVNKPTKF